MPPDVDAVADLDLNGVFDRALTINPFLDNRVNGPAPGGADVAGIHQAAFERLTALAGDALATHRGLGALLWGEAGIGKSHVLARLARWSDDHATFVYLHNLQAAPKQLPRSVLRAVVAALTRGRTGAFLHTPLGHLVHAGLLEAIQHRTGRLPWDFLHRAWNAWVDRLVAGEHPGLAGADRTPFEVLYRFYYSAHRSANPHDDGTRREDGSVARWAVQYLSGIALEADEGRALGLPLPARDDAVALADAQQIKQVLVVLSRLAAARRQPFVLAFDQVDNLDTDQASALARFLEALLDAAPNLLVVTAGVRASLLRWLQTGVIQHSSWDRLAQFEIELQRVGGAEAGDLIRARLEEFFRPFDALDDLRQRRGQDAYFPLGQEWYERQFRDQTDLRPRDVISQAREAWRAQQEQLRKAGVEAWGHGEPGDQTGTRHEAIEVPPPLLDQMLDEKIAQLCPVPTVPPKDDDADDLAELLRKVLIQCRKADASYGVVEVESAPLSKKHKRPLYDLSVLLRDRPDTPSVRVGVLALTSTRGNHVAACLRRLTNELPAIDRLFVVTQEWIGLPLGERGKVYLTVLQGNFAERLQLLEVTPTEYCYLDALRTTAQLAQAGDLEVDVGGVARGVTEEQVLASHHRKDRYRSSRLLRKLLGTPAAVETLPETVVART